jgi:hypothetical protein
MQPLKGKGNMKKYLAAGMSGHIGKPISFDQALEVLRNHGTSRTEE